jgi:hypothetical protein
MPLRPYTSHCPTYAGELVTGENGLRVLEEARRYAITWTGTPSGQIAINQRYQKFFAVNRMPVALFGTTENVARNPGCYNGTFEDLAALTKLGSIHCTGTETAAQDLAMLSSLFSAHGIPGTYFGEWMHPTRVIDFSPFRATLGEMLAMFGINVGVLASLS